MIQELANIISSSTVNSAIAILWLGSALLDYGELLYLAQLKEYRLDRFKDFLSTKQGKKFWFNYGRMMRLLLAFMALLWPVNDVPTIKIVLIALLTVDVTYAIYHILKRLLPRPKITVKVIFIFSVALFIEVLLLGLARDWALAFLILIMRAFIVGIAISLSFYPTAIAKKFIIFLAAKKLKKYKKLTVIGITGSYGKSTVKEFLSHLLSSKFEVIKTPKNINTEIGIAKLILKTDFSNADVFVVEMGAYKLGEIKLICDMVKPKIGILTAINEQHLSLFGSLKNTQQAKFELLRSIPKDGLAVSNVDNPLCREFLHDLEATVQTYGSDAEFKPTVMLTEINQDKDEKSISGKSIVYGVEYDMSIPVVGAHNAWNFAAAGLVAGYLGLSYQEINNKAQTLTLPSMTLEQTQYGNCTVINDSYNSNPDGFKAALHLLSSFSSARKKIVITRGMVELGDKSDEIHEDVAGEIDFIADVLVIISEDFSESLQKGVVGKYRTDILLRYESENLLKYVKSLKDTDSVILIENRIPALVYKEIFGEV